MFKFRLDDDRARLSSLSNGRIDDPDSLLADALLQVADHVASMVPIRRPVAVSGISVVCDDGSVWRLLSHGKEWEELVPIPGSARERELTKK